MKITFIKFILWFYTNHIQEDWSDYNKIGKIIIFPAWFVRSVVFWIVCPLFIPEYMFKQSEVYHAFEQQGKLTPQQMAEFNKIQKQNFLNKKYGKNGQGNKLNK